MAGTREVATAGLALLLAGCGADDRQPTGPTGGTPLPTAPGVTAPPGSGNGGTASTATATQPPVTGVPGAPQDVVTGLDVPWGIAALPDGGALLTLRDQARVLRLHPDGEVTRVAATGADGRIPDVDTSGEGGLLGVTLSPSFTEDRLVYLYLTTGSDNRVVRAELDRDTLGPLEVVLSGIPASRVHDGGRIAFGPDGMLYAATGDAQDPDDAQEAGSLAGKILRMTPDGGVPEDNPFDGSPVWSLGHRNVQGLGWDGAGRMYASEFGSDELDELNLIQPGGNYGWPLVEGPGGGDDLTDPLLTWRPADASPSGLLVTGDAIYLAALRGQRLWRVPLDSGRVGEPEAFLTDELGRLRAVTVAPDGQALWVLTNNTARGEPRPGDDRLVRLPLQ